MKILILGVDGYLGWPTAMHFAAQGHQVVGIDNYLRRNLCAETSSLPLIPPLLLDERVEIFKSYYPNASLRCIEGDLRNKSVLDKVLKDFMPDALVHYAEQPSGPFSMRDFNSSELTFKNNLEVTFNVINSVLENVPECHIVKLGTMGEYGTPNIDIEEGWIQINHKGRSDKFLYPRQASTLYHTTKVLDTDLLWFYVRTYGLKVTDLMQGPVFGLVTPETRHDDQLLPIFNYDDIFGTVINRFLVQAASGIPLTVYGKGGQTRGYLNLIDTLQCIELSITQQIPKKGELRILNQFVEQFTVNQLADLVVDCASNLGIKVDIQKINNPRKEAEDHYYNAAHTGLNELGLVPNPIDSKCLQGVLSKVLIYKDNVDTSIIMPRVAWS